MSEQPDVYVIEVGDSVDIQPIEVGPAPDDQPVTVPVDIVGARRLDDLEDVDSADGGSYGDSLVRDYDGQWRPRFVAPGEGGGGGGYSWEFEQVEPSTVWLVGHGLPFFPAGIEVQDHMGQSHVPLISWPDQQTVLLTFDYPVRGIVRLS